jgi:hypothetical protein
MSTTEDRAQNVEVDTVEVAEVELADAAGGYGAFLQYVQHQQMLTAMAVARQAQHTI